MPTEDTEKNRRFQGVVFNVLSMFFVSSVVLKKVFVCLWPCDFVANIKRGSLL